MDYMKQALSLATLALGQVSPNPAVGAVVVKDGEVVGQGYTQPPGSWHAEVIALKQAGEKARGGVMHVTLEPCCYQGRTPPCTQAIIDAGISEVHLAMLDPNPLVSGRGEEEYRSLLALAGEDNSFYRDMACLGLGLSYLGTGDRSVSMLLEDMATTDGHPYVRESALFGLALTHFQRPDAQVMQLLTDGLQDDSAIVRSGASLGLGIVAMGTGDLQVDLMEHSDFSVLWGLTISEGLANLAPSQREFRSGYVQWGHNISNGFRDDTQEVFESDHSDVLAFQEEVNAGLIGAGALARRQRDELRLIVPGVFHYLMYDSFWWGLWVLNSLGTTLLAGRD